MTLNKWNYYEKKYEPHEILDSWQVTTSPNNTACDCPHCGKRILINTAYTSLEIHDNFGFGFYVCSDCYSFEAERRYFAKQLNRNK